MEPLTKLEKKMDKEAVLKLVRQPKITSHDKTKLREGLKGRLPSEFTREEFNLIKGFWSREVENKQEVSEAYFAQMKKKGQSLEDIKQSARVLAENPWLCEKVEQYFKEKNPPRSEELGKERLGERNYELLKALTKKEGE